MLFIPCLRAMSCRAALPRRLQWVPEAQRLLAQKQREGATWQDICGGGALRGEVLHELQHLVPDSVKAMLLALLKQLLAPIAAKAT